jgi:creatinine amidohydrolase
MMIRMEDMTWLELQAALRGGFDTVLLVLGSIEQHGPHLPLATDTILGYAWGEAIARELGETLLAPVIRPGLSRHHLGFPGTLTLDEFAFQSTVEQVSVSLALTGFRTLIPFCSHGGNWPALFSIRRRLEDALPATTQLVLLDEATVEGIEREIYSFLRARGIPEAVAGIHAGLRETSHVLAVSASAVRRDSAVCGWVGESGSELLGEGKSIMEISETGVFGDATAASEELGRELNDLMVRLYADAFRAAAGPDTTEAT